MRPTTTAIKVFINKHEYRLEYPEQTGASLKELAGIPLCDVLFLQGRCEDEVIANDAKVLLRDCDQLHSQPPANYGYGGDLATEACVSHDRLAVYEQPGGWKFVVISDFAMPEGYAPTVVELLVKLPPLFPEAAPDMFWVRPAVKLRNGQLPRSTSNENLLGGTWQRFSWHLVGNAWKPGTSTFRDFVRCVRGRLLRED